MLLRLVGEAPAAELGECLLSFAPDFDGTMFIQDTGHILFDTHGCGRERRKELSGSIRSGRRPFRETSDEMWGTLDVPFEKGCDLIKSGLIVDPGFEDYYRFCMDNGIPFHVMSSGMEPILRSVLELYFGREGVSAHNRF